MHVNSVSETPDGTDGGSGVKSVTDAATQNDSKDATSDPGYRWYLALGAALSTGLAAHLRYGYAFGDADQLVLSVKGISRADPTSFVNDWFNANATQPHWTFDFITTVGETLGALPAIYLLYFVAALVAFGTATALLAGHWLPPRARWLALVVGPVLVLGPLAPLGSTTPVLPSAIPHVLGGCLAYLAVALLLVRRPLAATIVTVLVALVHVQHGANLAVVLLLYAAVATDESKRDRWAMAAGGSFAALHAVVATRVLGITGNGDDFVEICRLRSPHHCDANSWSDARLVVGWYLAAMVALLIWTRRRDDLRVLLVTLAVPLAGLLAGVWADRLDVAFFGELAQSTNIYRLVALVLPLAAWAPIVAMGDVHREYPRALVALLSCVLLVQWYGSDSGVADLSAHGSLAVLLSLLTVCIVALTLWSTFPSWTPKALGVATVVVLLSGFTPLALRDLTIGHDPTDPRVEVGNRIEESTPPGSVIAARPGLSWLRALSRRAVVTDCKAVPYGGQPWQEHMERIEALGGWENCKGVDVFASLSLDDVEDLGDRFGATHMLIGESDPKYLSAADAGWRLVDEFPPWGSAASGESDDRVPLPPMRLFEIR